MQIHELPSASPSASDYIPIDNGTATRKATLSSIDMGSNEITFTSGDTSSPSSWQTVAVMASNTAANLMNAISKMVANIRWLYNRLGTSSTGTTATTVTGAIAEHSTKIGSAEMGTTATTLTGAIAEVNDSVNTNTEDIATLNSNFAMFKCINLGSTGGTDITVNTTSWVVLATAASVSLKAGSYMFIFPINATWSGTSYQFYLGLRVGAVDASSNSSWAYPQTNGACVGIGTITIPTDGTYNVSALGRVTSASKTVTVNAFQNSSALLMRVG